MKELEKWELENAYIEERLKQMRLNKSIFRLSDYTTDELIIKWDTLKQTYLKIRENKESVLGLKDNKGKELDFIEKCAEIGFDSALGTIRIEIETIEETIAIRKRLN